MEDRYVRVSGKMAVVYQGARNASGKSVTAQKLKSIEKSDGKKN
jgi:hypothetical protein